MKVFAILALCAACCLAAPQYGGYSSPAPTPVLKTETYGGYSTPSVKAVVPIVRYLKTDDNYGTYSLDVQTGDGSSHIENGQLKSVSGPDSHGLVNVKEGSYSWTSPEGEVFTVTYTADENGFRASGAHLPTPPPVPEEILKSLSLPRVVDAYSPSSSSGYSAPALKVQTFQPTFIRSGGYA